MTNQHPEQAETGKQSSSSPLLLGHARAEITPPLGLPMAGYAWRKNDGCTAVDDPLYADACLLQQGETRFLLITTDLCSVDENWSAPLRERIAASTGISPQNIVITASHTHFGPKMMSKPISDAHQAWQEETWNKLHDIAFAASTGDLQPVSLRWAISDFSQIAFNRRPVRPDGTCCTTYNLPPSEENLRFRPIDPKQTVLRFDNAAGTPVLLLVSTPMHAVVGGTNPFAISADYPGVLRSCLEEVYHTPLMFLAGTAGNVVPIKRGPGMRRIIGGYLAGAAVKAIESAPKAAAGEGRLGVVSHRFALPAAKRLSEEEMRQAIAQAQEQLAQCRAAGASPWEIARAEYRVQRAEGLLQLTLRRGQGTTIPWEITVLAFDRLSLAFLPGEILAETGLQIQARSPFDTTVVASLANLCPGYLATRNTLWEGGYEGSFTQVYSEESELHAVDTAIKLLLEAWEKTRY